MNELDQIINTSGLDSHFARAISDAAYAMFEARNINKDYLKQEADATGDPTRFQTARQAVQALWGQEDMAHQLNEKAGQKVLNFLYLMEIRSPGFTTPDKLHAIHDLFVGNTLDTKFLSQVNSDTTPDQAAQVLASATEHQVKSAKVYPDLTDEEEAIWNRVRVFHEFDDGFKWVYAVKADGTIASHIPSSITFKTMHHCGNTPDANSDNQYWELRGPDGKAYLTVILSPDGKIEESKSWGNQPNKYRRMIQPYVKWFLKNKVTGVGRRYDYGYATHNNFGVKDFMGDDPEFIEYVSENKPELFGNTEKRIMFWKEAIQQGILTVDDIKRMFSMGLTLEEVLSIYDRLRDYHSTSRFSDWGENNGRVYYNRNNSVFGSNPFDVVCAACDGCPFNKEELKRLIMDRKVSLEEFANYDIHLLDGEMQKTFVSASPYNLNTLMRIAADVGTFEIADDIMTALIDIVKEPRPRPPENYDTMTWMQRQGNQAVLAYDNARNRWDSALNALRQYMREANPPEKARKVVDAVFGDRQVMENIFGNGNWDPRLGVCDVDSWLDVFARFSDLQIPDTVMNSIGEELFTDGRKSNRTLQTFLRIGRPRIDPMFENKTAKQIVALCLDTSERMKLDARNLLTTVRNLGKVVQMFPEYSNVYTLLRPSLRLGYYCCAPKNEANKEAAVTLTVSQIHKGEKIPTNPNAMLSATGAATMMAIGSFPEISQQVPAGEIGDYVFPQADMICHTYIREYGDDDGPKMLSERLIGILKEAYMSYDDDKKDWLSEQASNLFMCAHDRCNSVQVGDPIFTELYVHLAKSKNNGTAMERLTGYQFYPEIPASEWENIIGRIEPRNPKLSRERFVDSFILPGLNNGRYADSPEFLNFLVDYLMSPENTNPHHVLTSSKFRRRPILNKVKAAITSRIENGEDVSIELADTLNRAGILNKEFLTQAQQRRFDAQSESDIDESISGKIDQMCSNDILKRYKKSRNFPYFVNELLRAILEQYDLAYTEVSRERGTYSIYCDEVSFRMYARFSKVADCIASTPKAPYCVAAAKLAERSGLLDAYRMVAERYGQGDDRRPLIMMRNVQYGDYDLTTDLSPDFNDKIGKLEQMAKTKQKYKAGEGELPMK
ncbi:MAG: hypothetical protein IKA48_00795 [Fibrobacter sp.]|nr:hypothetical protein [Fibrobacter sp.]